MKTCEDRRSSAAVAAIFALANLTGAGCLCNAGRDGVDSGETGDAGGSDAAPSDASGPGGDATPGADSAVGTDAGPSCLDHEECGNELDDDCDALVDEDCACSLVGETRDCYPAPYATLGVGVCTVGMQTCSDTGRKLPSWNACSGAVTPSTEICNGSDDDCNGLTDDGFADASCGVGACARTVATCAAGIPATCTPGAPTSEVCNGLDDDCNGIVDDAPGTSCELCNGMDDDGDGMVDEDQGMTTCGVGACTVTMPNCVAGMPNACTPGPSSPESCDGGDNDCDGMIDEGLGTITCGLGSCAVTVPACTGGTPGTCTPGASSPEVCDGLDNDCDGSFDEGLGSTMCGTGACASTVMNCVSGVPQTCTPGPTAPEVCDGVDNDCNGIVDDSGVCGANMPPMVVCPADLTVAPLDTATVTGTATDADGTIASTGWSVTSAPTGSSSSPTPASGTMTSFFVDLAGPYTLTFCATDDDGATACCSVNIDSVPDEALRFELFWDAGLATSTADIDLHVLHESGTAWFTGWDCFFASCTGGGGVAWPPMGPSGNAYLDLDDVDGYGPENINVPTPDLTVYRAGVHYWNPWGEGAAMAVVRVWCNGSMVYESAPTSLYATPGANAATSAFWKVADVTWVGGATGCTVSPLGTITTSASASTAP